MKTVYLSILCGTAAIAFSATHAGATDAVVEIDPGLYAYNTVMTVGGFEQMNDAYEYCLTPDLTKRSMSELVQEISGDGNCTISNTNVGNGTGSADVNCDFPDMGFTSTGTITATYSKTAYHAVTRATINQSGAEIKADVKATRISACPPGWTPPPGISHK